MELATRRIVWFAVTDRPDGAWVTHHDHDAKYAGSADGVLEAAGMRVIKTPIAAPKANAHMERQIWSGRRECFDWDADIRPPSPGTGNAGVDRALQRSQASPRSRSENPDREGRSGCGRDRGLLSHAIGRVAPRVFARASSHWSLIGGADEFVCASGTELRL